MTRAFAVALLTFAAHAAAAADYAREDRWAQEIVPSLVVGDAVWLATPARPKVLALYTEPSGRSKAGVVIVHGLGVHPDFGVVGSLRAGLADAGFATLSVQMPVLAAGAARDDYRQTLPEAGERIAAAIGYLRDKGVAKVAVVTYSLGATMANAYFARPDARPIDAWVTVGMLIDFDAPPRVPVLDVVAEKELPEAVATAPLRAMRLPKDRCSRQTTIAGADHYLEGRYDTLGAVVASFLVRVAGGDC